jgi:methylthioribulose-1-phosphate dehydratase
VDESRASLAVSLAAAAEDFHRRGWCLGTSGNFSAVLAREPLELLITASGLDKSGLRPADFVRVAAGGEPGAGETGRASAETRLHLAVCIQRGAGCVLHTHSHAATLLGERFCEKGGFTVAGYEMLKGLEGVRSHEAEEFVPVLANSQDMTALAREVERVLARRPEVHGLLLAGHGLYTWGEDVTAARRHVEILEFLFELTLRRTQLAPFAG